MKKIIFIIGIFTILSSCKKENITPVSLKVNQLITPMHGGSPAVGPGAIITPNGKGSPASGPGQ